MDKWFNFRIDKDTTERIKFLRKQGYNISASIRKYIKFMYESEKRGGK